MSERGEPKMSNRPESWNAKMVLSGEPLITDDQLDRVREKNREARKKSGDFTDVQDQFDFGNDEDEGGDE